MQRLRATAQHAGVSRLEADSRRIGGHVRTRFVDHSHHAERDAYALQQHASLDRALLEHAADRVGK